jgi:O-acetyl-ADP-ribose deacetylase (regulator of RNase III)
MLVDSIRSLPPALDYRESSPKESSVEMLNEVEGDLIEMAMDGAFDVIAHGCNCFHTMNAGIAARLATQCPGIRSSDRRTIYGDRAKLGTYSSTEVYPNNSARLLTILNCYTQFRYGRTNNGRPNCDYAAIGAVMTG